jgi:hypothetical protein
MSYLPELRRIPGIPRQEFLLDFKKRAQYTRHLAWFAAP